MAAALATPADVVHRLGRELSETEAARVDTLLPDVSSSVRRAAGGQTLTAVTADTVRLTPRAAEKQLPESLTWERFTKGLWAVRLPQRPVTAVASVKDTYGEDVGYVWQNLDFVYTYSSAIVDITYDHGYDTIPDDLVGVVCQVVIRNLGMDPTASGVTQQTIAGYQEMRAANAAGGPFGLLDEERAICAAYNLRAVGPVRML